jgi:hypothetical protein
MPPTAEDRLLDILEAIAEIDEMLAGFRLELRESFLTVSSRRNETSIGAK